MVSWIRLVYGCAVLFLLYIYWYAYQHSLCVPAFNHRRLHIPTTGLLEQAMRNDSSSYADMKTAGASSFAVDFHPDGSDTLAFLHIQKTGGSEFLQKLYTLQVGAQCQLRTKRKLMKRKAGGKQSLWCPRPGVYSSNDTWIFSTKTFGWVCGLHPTWTEYQDCVPQYMDAMFGRQPRRYLYLTVLRHPVARFASEYLHARRGATWFYLHKCRGQQMGPAEVPPCYDGYYEGKSWPDLTFEKFISCQYNQAINRQTTMLADLRLVGCYEHVKHPTKATDNVLLTSAKRNIKEFAGFVLSEYQTESQLILEHQLGHKFSTPLEDKAPENQKSGDLVAYIMRRIDLYDRVARLNHLDMELYRYALDLFASRLAALGGHLDTNKLMSEINKLEFDENSLQTLL